MPLQCPLGVGTMRLAIIALVAIASAAFSDEGSIGPAFHYTMPADGEVTLGVFDPRGICFAGSRGPSTAVQDRTSSIGTDWISGASRCPQGRIRSRPPIHPELKTEYQLTFGNPGNPPWPTPDGRGDWLGDEASPQAAATDGRWVFLASPGSEKGHSIIAVDGHGRRQWGVDEELYPRSVSLALAGDYLYALFSGPELTADSRRDAAESTSQQRRYDGKNAIGRGRAGLPRQANRQPGAVLQGESASAGRHLAVRREGCWIVGTACQEGIYP